jgi:ferredoxin
VERKLAVDKGLCIGSDLCTHTAPATFEIKGDGYAGVFDPPGDQDEAIMLAARECPVRAILVDGNAPEATA